MDLSALLIFENGFIKHKLDANALSLPLDEMKLILQTCEWLYGLKTATYAAQVLLNSIATYLCKQIPDIED